MSANGKQIDIDDLKRQSENLHRNGDEKKKIKVELVYDPFEENKFFLFQVLNILLPEEAIRNYLMSKNRVVKPKNNNEKL